MYSLAWLQLHIANLRKNGEKKATTPKGGGYENLLLGSSTKVI
jgi:hypothetical protein